MLCLPPFWVGRHLQLPSPSTFTALLPTVPGHTILPIIFTICLLFLCFYAIYYFFPILLLYCFVANVWSPSPSSISPSNYCSLSVLFRQITEDSWDDVHTHQFLKQELACIRYVYLTESRLVVAISAFKSLFTKIGYSEHTTFIAYMYTIGIRVGVQSIT